MVQVVPAGIFQRPYLLKYLVANSQTFRDAVGVYEIHEAAERVHYPATNLAAEGHYPPWAVINCETEYSTHRTGNETWIPRGSMELSFDLYAPEEYETHEDRCAWFLLTTGKIISEMQVISTARSEGPIAGESHLDVTGFTAMQGGPYEVELEEWDVPDNADFARRALWHHQFTVEHM